MPVKYPYNYVSCNQAQKIITNNFQEKAKDYTASLMFGVQWDLVLKYLQNKGANPDSVNMGNYYDTIYNIQNSKARYSSNDGVNWNDAPYNKTEEEAILLTTGASDEFKKQNIYDIAGNVREWTLEYTFTTDYPFANRGGRYNTSSSDGSASSRYAGNTGTCNSAMGFRVSIY